MNNVELEELIVDCPKLYHAANSGSWKGITENGLLSTSALLDLYGISGAKREKIESQRRPFCVELIHTNLPRVVVRDQKPMDDSGLRRCLPSRISPSYWYRLLNSRVFFWLTEERLHRIINAAPYRDSEHEVLIVDTSRIVEKYFDKVWLCPINSGCTRYPKPAARDENTFQRIPDYPYEYWRKKKKRMRGERVVELCVDYSIPDIMDYVERVYRIKGHHHRELIFEA